MSDDDKLIHIRLPRTVIKRIEHVKIEWGVSRSKTIIALLEGALRSVEERDGR